MTTDDDRFDLLCEKYLDGVLAGSDRDELQQLLRDHPARRKELAIVLMDEHSCQRILSPMQTAQDRVATGAATVRRSRRQPSAHPRRFAARARPRSWSGLLAAGLALMTLGGGMAWYGLQDRQTASAPLAELSALPRIAEAHDVTIHTIGNSPRPALDGEPLLAGEHILTADSGHCVLRYPEEDTSIELSAQTELILLDAHPGKQLRLDHGRITAVVAHQLAGQPMLVSTPQVTATVIGTRFQLTAAADATHLTVSEGVVRCAARNGQVLEVAAGAMADAPSTGGVVVTTADAQAPFGAWAPLTPGTSIVNWVPFSGTWSVVDGSLVGSIDPASQHARLDSSQALPRCEITCSLRGINCRYAEIGVHDFAGYLPLELGAEGGWHQLHVLIQGAQASAELDGVSVAYQGEASATGVVAFYASSGQPGARIEIRDARIRK